MNNSRCGTYAGYRFHINHKEIVCISCKKAQRAYQKQYYAKNTEKSKLRKKRYRDKPEAKVKEKEYRVQYALKNFDKNSVKNKLWRQNNPEKVREISLRKRAKKLDIFRIPYTDKQVLDTYGSLCHICGTDIDLTAPRIVGKQNWQMGLHIDHVIPMAKGGSDTLDNVRPARALCNVRKGSKIITLLKEGEGNESSSSW